MTGLLVILSSLLTIIQCSALEGDMNCKYYYIRQPSSDQSCNPWPLANASNNTTGTLTLHCDIIAPQNNDLPNVQWYRVEANDEEQDSRITLYPGGSEPKYTAPISSKDLANSLRRVNFSLVINNVNVDDTGCYLCEVHVSAGNSCWFDIRPSNQFCLLQQDEYRDKVDCVSVPVNTSFMCAANQTCDSGPATLEPTTDSVVYSVNSLASSPQVTSLDSPMSYVTTKATVSASLETSLSIESSSTIDSTTTSDFSKQTSYSSQQTSINQGSNTPVSVEMPPSDSIQDNSAQFTTTQSISPSSVLQFQTVPVIVPRPSSPARSSQQQLRIGLYIGVGVCSLLLMVIIILLAAVAVLCKKKDPRVKRQGIDSRSQSPNGVSSMPTDAIWSRPNATQPTAIINEEGRTHLLTNQSPPPPVTDSTLTSSLLNGNVRDRKDKLKRRRDELLLQHRGSLPITLPSREQQNNGLHTHHRLSLANQLEEDSHMTSQADVSTSPRLTSPESHYYHVLEQPRYYNFNWLASNPEGRELLLQNWKEGDDQLTDNFTSGSKRKRYDDYSRHNSTQYDYADDFELGDIPRPQIVHDSSEERDKYHWKVFIPPIKGKTSERWASPRRQKQLYARLDCATMEPKREYTKVSIKRTDKDKSN